MIVFIRYSSVSVNGACKNHMLEDGCIDQKVRSNSFIITITIENAVSSQFTLMYEFYYVMESTVGKNYTKSCQVRLQQMETTKSWYYWHILTSAKSVNRMWLQNNLVFQVEYIEEEQCCLFCNPLDCNRSLVRTQLSLRVSCCYYEHSSSSCSNWHVKICHQISLLSTLQPKWYRQGSVQQGLGQNIQ